MQRHQQKQHVFLIILVLLHTMVCFNLKFTYNFALLINMMLLMKKGILGCNIIFINNAKLYVKIGRAHV